MFDLMTLRPQGDEDPPPFHLLNTDGAARALLVCDHASNALPRRYGTLGIDPDKMFEHIAWDVGAAAVTRTLSDLLDAPAIMGGASRLLVDLNRYPEDPSAIPARSDGTHVTGNDGIGEAERTERLAWHATYHAEVERLIAGFDGAPVLLFIHSFTPRIGGKGRPWHLGVLHHGGSPESDALLKVLHQDTAIVTGDNQPYSVDQPKSHSIFRHAIDAGRPYIALEIRQDLIETLPDAETWAERIATAFREALSPGGFFGEA
ncbi:MAG: N-formylglutamate amidohydrolase [Minwuia sp.]|uniref:N-formylglutamate amidohydrolase n=1 Tax=Minwuia sp. TaxID=2493630 RepID=UPI003A84C7F3